MMDETGREHDTHESGGLRIVALGHVLRPLERISVMGQLMGLGSRSTAYRMSVGDEWPLVGPETSQWVLVIPLLQRYGIPYTIRESALPVGDDTEQESATGEAGVLS